MSALEFSLYENLKKKLDEETARQLITYVKEEVNQNKLATKNDLAETKIDLIKWMLGFWITLVLLILANWFFK